MTAPQMSLFSPAPMLRDRPALATVPLTSAITLRDYQRAAIEAIEGQLASKRSTLVVMATGCGKTVIFAALARKRGGALVIAHEDSLIQQAAQKLRHTTGEYVAVEKAERRSMGAKYVVASMQSLRGERLKAFAQTHAHIDFIVIDEAHRALAKSYRDILAAFPNAKVLGVTATADRGDKKAMGLVFESVAYRYDIIDATRDGWLTPISWIPVDVSGVALDSVSVKGGDLDQDELDELTSQRAAEIAKAMHVAAAGRRSVAFTPGVKTAQVASEALNRLEAGCARSIDGSMETEQKRAIKDGHKRGEFPHLLNCQILIEGYDDAELLCGFLFAKTKSRARWAQMAGRLTRLWPVGIDHLATPEERRAAIAASPKPTAYLFDANYGSHGHTLAGPIDLLGGRYDDEVKERARKKLENGGGDVAAALEEAKAEIEEAKRKKLAAQAARAAKARGEVLVGAARAAAELFGASTDMGAEDEPRGEPIEGVIQWLVEKGVKNADTMSANSARALKRQLKDRQRLGLCTFKQANVLRKHGVEDAGKLTFHEASRLMGVLGPQMQRGNWGYKFEPAQVAQLLGREVGGEG